MSMPFYVSPEQVMADKAEYARKGISRGKPSVTLEFEGGVVLMAEQQLFPHLHLAFGQLLCGEGLAPARETLIEPQIVPPIHGH